MHRRKNPLKTEMTTHRGNAASATINAAGATSIGAMEIAAVVASVTSAEPGVVAVVREEHVASIARNAEAATGIAIAAAEEDGTSAPASCRNRRKACA